MFVYSGREVYEIMTKEKRPYEKQRFAQRRMWMLLATITQEYVDELKEINSLESDSIQESKYLMIAYYDEEFR